MIFPAWGFQPGVFALDIELLVWRFRPGIVEFGFAVEGMQPAGLATSVGVPGMRNVLLDLLGITAIHRIHLVQVAIENGSPGELEVLRLVVAASGQVAIGEIVLQAAANRRPIFVEARDGHQIGQIYLFDKRNGAGNQAADLIETFGVNGIYFVGIDRAGRSSDQVIGMRVLAAEDGMYLDDFPLPFQRFQVMRHRQQVHLWGQLVGWISPVAVGKDAQLARLHEPLQPLLHRSKVPRRTLWPCLLYTSDAADEEDSVD